MKLRRAWALLTLAIALLVGADPLASQSSPAGRHPVAPSSTHSRVAAPSIARVDAAAVRVVIEESAVDSAGLITLAVRLRATGLELGAYQGKLEFEPGSLDIVSATSPRGDGTRMVNAADSVSGVVRFAGYAVPGFDDDLAMTLVVRPRSTMAAARVRAALEVAGDADGVPISVEAFIPALKTTRTSP